MKTVFEGIPLCRVAGGVSTFCCSVMFRSPLSALVTRWIGRRNRIRCVRPWIVLPPLKCPMFGSHATHALLRVFDPPKGLLPGAMGSREYGRGSHSLRVTLLHLWVLYDLQSALLPRLTCSSPLDVLIRPFSICGWTRKEAGPRFLPQPSWSAMI
jgi:hypothetical protein